MGKQGSSQAKAKEGSSSSSSSDEKDETPKPAAEEEGEGKSELEHLMEISRLERLLSGRDNDILTLQSQMVEVVTERDALTKERTALAEERDRLQRERAELESERDALAEEIGPLRQEEERQRGVTDMFESFMSSTCQRHAVQERIDLEPGDEWWGLRVEDLVALRDRIADDAARYCAAHSLYVEGGARYHVCKAAPCPFEDDHRQIYCLPAGKARGGGTRPLIPDMHLLVARYVRPETRAASERSYASKVRKGKRQLRGVAGTFVVHSWEESFEHLVGTLQLALGEQEIVFVAGLSLDQNSAPLTWRLSRETPRGAPFDNALHRSRQVLVVADSTLILPQRVWCHAEVFMALERQLPIRLWPHAGVDLSGLAARLEALDVRTAEASDPEDARRLRAALTSLGADHVNLRLRRCLRDRLTAYRLACGEMEGEWQDTDTARLPDAAPLRLRQLVADCATAAPRRAPLAELLLRTDVEYGEVAGPLFDSSLVARLPDVELNRDVYLVSGVCFFKCSGELAPSRGDWRVGFVVKRSEAFQFGTDLVLLLNGREVRRVKLEDELQVSAGWTVLEFGEVQGCATAELQMIAADCEAGSAGQLPKAGLYVDRVIATRRPL